MKISHSHPKSENSLEEDCGSSKNQEPMKVEMCQLTPPETYVGDAVTIRRLVGRDKTKVKVKRKGKGMYHNLS